MNLFIIYIIVSQCTQIKVINKLKMKNQSKKRQKVEQNVNQSKLKNII